MLTPWDPLGYKVAHYQQARRLVLANTQAAGPLWEFRWGTATTSKCFITKVILKGIQTNTSANPQEFRFNMKIARSFTAADNANVVSILRSGDMQQLNTAFAASLLTDFVESNSATAPTGGTYTQDTDPVVAGAYSTVGTPTVDGGPDDLLVFNPYTAGDQVLRLGSNEGFIINLEATGSATPSLILFLEVTWVEAFKAP